MKNFTAFLISFVCGLIPEVFIAYVVMKLTDEGWSIFWITYIGIQVFHLIIWFFRSLVTWVFYNIFWKKEIVNGLYSCLNKYQYRTPLYVLNCGHDAEVYFEDTVYDPEIDPETRIHAGSVLTRITFLRELGHIQGLYRFRKAALHALRKFTEKNTIDETE